MSGLSPRPQKVCRCNPDVPNSWENLSNPTVYYQYHDCERELLAKIHWERWGPTWEVKEGQEWSGKNDGHPRKTDKSTWKQKPKGGRKKKRKSGRRVNGRGDKKLCDVGSSDLMFSIVSSGMGATVCTAGRFLLVAPLTNDEEEDEDEEAESVAPRRQDRVMKNQTCITETWIKRDLTSLRDNNEGNVLMSQSAAAKFNLDSISLDMLLLVCW